MQINSSTFQYLYRRTNLAHERADKPSPGHPHQAEVSKGIPGTAPNKRKTSQPYSGTDRSTSSPNRTRHTREDGELALDEGEQTEEGEVALELGLVPEMLEVRIVRIDDLHLRAFRIALHLLFAGLARRALPRSGLYRCRHILWFRVCS
jgi:hypothetical protein